MIMRKKDIERERGEKKETYKKKKKNNIKRLK